MENLNKKNIWNKLYKTCPKTMKKFCKWIDVYKKKYNWDDMFNAGCETGGWKFPNSKNGRTVAPKYHDLPLEMQVGILTKFFLEKKYNGSITISDGGGIKEAVSDVVKMFMQAESGGKPPLRL